MLASVLNSERAIRINIQVVRIFTRMREMLASHKELLNRLEEIEHTMTEHDNKFLVIFEYLKQLEHAKQLEQEHQNRAGIGFKRNNH